MDLIRLCLIEAEKIPKGIREFGSLAKEYFKIKTDISTCREITILKLFESVNSDNTELRRSCLAAQRLIYKYRTIPDNVSYVIYKLKPNLGQIIFRWNEILNQEILLKKEMILKMEDNRLEWRSAIKSALSTPRFGQALHAYNERLFIQAMRYKNNLETNKSIKKSDRQTENSLFNIYLRSATKTSPFSHFTSTALTDCQGQSQIKAQIRLARDMLQFLEAEVVSGVKNLADVVSLRPNEMLERREGRLIAFFRGVDGKPHKGRHERFLSLASNPQIDKAIMLAAKGLSTLEVANEMSGEVLNHKESTGLVQFLVDKGILYRDLGIPDDNRDYAKAIYERVSRLLPNDDLGVVDIFLKIVNLEKELNNSDSLQRVEICRAIKKCASDILEISKSCFKSIDDLQTLYYEDVVEYNTENKIYNKSAYDIKSFKRLREILIMFDDQMGARERLFLSYQAMKTSGRPIKVVDFYRYVMTEAEDFSSHPLLNSLYNQKEKFLSKVVQNIQKANGNKKLNLRIGDLVDEEYIPPNPQPSTFVAYCSKQMNTPSVLNIMTSGNGLHSHKIEDILSNIVKINTPGGATSNGSGVKAIKTLEFTGVLGFNSNVHNIRTDWVAPYPGTKSSCQNIARYSDIYVSSDCEKRALYLNYSDGTRFNVIASNAIHPSAAPSFYRFLYTFTEYFYYRSSDLVSAIARRGIRYIPRICVDEIVLVREAWIFPVSKLIDCVNNSNELERMLGVYLWQKKEGLPDSTFYHSIAQEIDQNIPMLELEIQLKARRGRMRKPQYIQFSNPIAVGVLSQQLNCLNKNDLVVFHEAFPDPAHISPRNVVREEVVEFNEDD